MDTTTVKDKTNSVEHVIKDRDYYKILLLSQSGKGKTYSARNLDVTSTAFLNCENKPLPFKNKFKPEWYGKPKRWSGVIKALDDWSKVPDIKTIFIDSFSAYSDLLLEEFRVNFKGYDIWSNYNMKIGEFLKKIKEIDKEVFVTGHYEFVNAEGDKEKRAKVKAKEWEGVIEKEFTVVLYGDSKFIDDKPKYFFVTAAEGASAKCPPGLLKDKLKLDNDCNEILTMIHEFTRE